MTATAMQSMAILSGFLLAGQASAQQRAPNRPQPSQLQGWGKTFAYQTQQLVSKPADIVFIGDSLTEFWTSTGKAIWQLEFHQFRAVNFGIAGDRTENILFRVTRVNLASHASRMFVLLAGTNNLSREPPDSPEETVLAIKTIVDYIAKQCPESKILLLSLPPNGYEPNSPLRKRVIETNRRLKELLLPEQVNFINIYPTFTGDDHRWKRGMTIDGTHFSQQGYDYLARTLKPAIETLKAETKAQTRDEQDVADQRPARRESKTPCTFQPFIPVRSAPLAARD